MEKKNAALRKTLAFIDIYWDSIIHEPTDSQGDTHAIPLPHPFIVTNANQPYHWKGSIFYWDSFFICKGLIDTPRQWIIPDMVDNFVYLFKQFGVVPNASRWAFLDRSQPPFFSSMTFDAYNIIRREKNNLYQHINPESWLADRMNTVKHEYWQVWEDELGNYHHMVRELKLNRYGERDVGYSLTSERESGWDFTTRFYNRCNEFLPVDLNAYLYKYEEDFAKTAILSGNTKDGFFWENRAKKRSKRMHKYMWSSKNGFFFDYDYVNHTQSEFYSLAGFVPLWAGITTREEAEKMIRKLPLFETDYGLVITSKSSLPKKIPNNAPLVYKHTIEHITTPKQWDYPHIWPPLEYLTVIGLLRYGFINEATQIMKKSIAANIHIFKKYGSLLEKIDATTGDKPKAFWYPTQVGFGWTNAIFYRYTKLLEIIEEKNGDIYGDRQEPPYSLENIVH